MRSFQQKQPIFARRRLGVLASALFAWPLTASAIDYTWDGGSVSNNFWTDSTNWNPNGVPTISSLVTFPTLGSPILVTQVSPGTLTANAITFDSTDPVVIQTGGFGISQLFLNSGTITRTAASAGGHSIGPAIVLMANGLWTINGSGYLTVAAIDENVAGLNLTKAGAGTLYISGSSSYTGTTTVSAGSLFANSNSLGAGSATVVSGATIGPYNSVAVNHAVTINGIGVGGNGAMRGTVVDSTWAGGVTLGTDSSIGVDNNDTLTVSGLITDGAATRSLTKVGPGTLILSAANTYNGSTNVSAGLLELDHPTAAAGSNVTVSSGASVAPGDGIVIANAAYLNGTGQGAGGALRSPAGGIGTWSGTVIMQSNSSLGAGAGEDLSITGLLGGAFSPTKVGAGQVTLTNSNNYTGTMNVSSGVLRLRNPNALSATSAGTVVQSGATVGVQQTLAHVPLNVNKPVSLNGAGADGKGALRNLADNNIWSGAITLQSNSSVGVDGDVFSISGVISGGFDLTKVGPGTLVLSNSSNSYNNTIVNEGILSMTVPTAFPAAGTITVNSGGMAELQGSVSFSRALALGGLGISEAGALHFISGNSVWSGNVAIAGGTSIGVDAGELKINGALSGSGGLLKVGAGKLTLAAANTNTGGVQVYGGVLSVENASAIPAGTVANIAGGGVAALEIRGGITAVGGLEFTGSGILNTGALRNPSGTNTWAGPITLAFGDAAIGVDAASQLTVSGVITDSASVFPLNKVGAGTLVLSAVNTYDGGTIINGGTLSISANNNLGNASGAVTTNNGGKLLVSSNIASGRTFNLNTGSLQVGLGATLTYTNATVNGGFLRGPGTHAIGTNSTFSGVTALNGTNITQSLPATLVNFTNAGTLISSAALTWDGGFNTSSGNITVNNSFNTQGFENDGVITVNSGGAITNTTSPLVSGGGARITINAGGTINAGPSFELNGSLLVNNGTVTGTTNVNYGALAKGSGTYGAVNVTDGGKFSPGNSPGSVTTGSATWNSGGNYLVEIADAISGAGDGWDMWLIDGQLNLNATATSNGRFTIALSTLDGLADNFDFTRDYAWPILHVEGGIVGFDPSELALDVSGFKNNRGGGHFSIQNTATDLSLHFSSVPEPTSLAAALLIPLVTFRRRRHS